MAYLLPSDFAVLATGLVSWINLNWKHYIKNRFVENLRTYFSTSSIMVDTSTPLLASISLRLARSSGGVLISADLPVMGSAQKSMLLVVSWSSLSMAEASAVRAEVLRT